VDSIPERDDVQVIVVDDNSDVDKKPELREHKNLQVVLLDATQAKGAGRARNLGLKCAMGNWLIFADSDDFFSEEISGLLDKYKDSDSDIIYFKVEGRNSDTLELVSRGMEYNRFLDKFKTKQTKISEDMLKYSHVIPWCKIIRRSLVSDNNIKFEEVKYSNDVMFVTHVAHCANKIEVSDVVAYNVTVRSGSLMTQQTSDSRRCRHDVSMRRLRFLWDNQKWSMMHPIMVTLIVILKKYGISELKVYVEIMKKNGIGWGQALITELLYRYNVLRGHYSYK